MKKIISYFVVLSALVIFTGCGSSMYVYLEKPTKIKKGETKYNLKEVNLKLKHGHGRNLENKTFKNQLELEKSFLGFISKELKKQTLFSEDSKYELVIDIDYTRTYNYGGNALNKPKFVYTVSVYNLNNKKLASYTIPESTTVYGTFKEMAVNAEIAVFKWNAEDEPQDIKLISKTLVKELSGLGE